MRLRPADAAVEERLRAHLPEQAFRPLAPAYLEEPRGRYPGGGGLVVAPASTDEVAHVVAEAAAAGVGVVPYGGGTGLVGGQTMPGDVVPLILSLERMRRVRAVYPAEFVMVAEAGAVLADLHAAAAEAGRLFPLALASSGSARIGGLLATNAGGIKTLRYGNARALCLGVEAVLADGRVLHGLSRLRKDNAGYDLRDLLIGAEGTLGVITAASLTLVSRPAAEGAALFAVAGPEAALELLSAARARLGEGISAFELMHRTGFDFLAETMPELRQPFDAPPEWALLLDLGLADGLDPGAALEALFAEAVERGLAHDGVIARSEAQRDALWHLRESIPEANRRIGAVASHDISVPLSRIGDFLRRGEEEVARIGDFRVNAFGHVGDGNLHFNVFPAQGRTAAAHEHQHGEVTRAVYDLVHAMGGSVAAEHGIGRAKTAELVRYADPARLATMCAVKAALDPHCIMNPGAVLVSDQ